MTHVCRIQHQALRDRCRHSRTDESTTRTRQGANMKLRFRCCCGSVLEAQLQTIGQTRRCPGCSEYVRVPTPDREIVRRALKLIPTPAPNDSVSELEQVVINIIETVEFNIQLCRHTGFLDLVDESIVLATSALRNAAVFASHQTQALQEQARLEQQPRVLALAHVAAGTNFGGIGVVDKRIRQSKRWLHGRPYESDVSRLAHSVHRRAIEAIQEIGRLS